MFLSILRVFEIRKAHIFSFLLINIFFGAMGVWAPLIQPWAAQNGEVLSKLIDVLGSGGAYTFAVAYLAASASYIVFEYLEVKEQNYKVAKVITTGIAVVLIVLCVLLTGPQLATPASPRTVITLGSLEWIQIVLTLLAIFTGFFLALIQWAGECSLDVAVDKSQAATKEESKKIFRNRQSRTN